MTENKQKDIGGGLRPLPFDSRDYSRTAVFGKMDPILLPDSLFLTTPTRIKDQGNSDLCGAFTCTSHIEFHEKVELSPEWYFAQIKKLAGAWDTWGVDMRIAHKAGVKVGALEQRFAPHSLNEKERDFVANWQNWDDDLRWAAAPHRQKTYFRVDDGEDVYNDIRNALIGGTPVSVGATWKPSWTETSTGHITNSAANEPGFGHMFLAVGWTKDYLTCQLSNGTGIGDGGYFHFHKDVVNETFTYGSYQFVDLSADEAKFLLRNGFTAGSFFSKLYRWVNYIIHG